MSFLRWSSISVLAAAFLMAVIPAQASMGFQPVSQDELKMASEPSAPGAPAVILYREVNRDDYGKNYHGGMTLVGEQSNPGRSEEDYFRIKILTEAGRNQANVQIRYIQNQENIGVVRARTIRPDGTIAEFDGKVYDKTIIKNKNFKYQAKTFALPDVQVGSIIEYFYTVNFQGSYIYSSEWILSQDLFTKKAKFTLKQFKDNYGQMSFRWTENLPPGVPEPKLGNDDVVRLEASNIPAFQGEDFMPPEDELRARVDFIYSYDAFESDPVKFWKKAGKKRNDTLEGYVGKRGAIEQAISQIVSPNDAPEVKLQKIYGRVQQVRNTSYEVHKTAQELKGQPEPANVEDVWKQGYGNDWHINWLYLALARAAGFEAYGVVVSDRKNFFFNPQTMQSGKLDRNLVLVKAGGKDYYLDPGSAFTPFGLLPWEDTGVPGLRLDKDGGTWIQTAVPDSANSHIERKAKLKLSESGDLDGKLTITYTGLEALRRRLEERNEDDVARKTYLEEEAKSYIPMGSDLNLSNKPDWSSSEPTLVAEFDLKVSGWTAPGPSRAFLPLSLFTAGENHLFDHATRVHPIYFEYPSQKLDDVTVAIPPGWATASIPSAVSQDVKVVAYNFGVESLNGTIHMTRKVDINIVLLDPKYYSPLQGFFQTVRKGDDQQAVLIKSSTTAGN